MAITATRPRRVPRGPAISSTIIYLKSRNRSGPLCIKLVLSAPRRRRLRSASAAFSRAGTCGDRGASARFWWQEWAHTAGAPPCPREGRPGSCSLLLAWAAECPLYQAKGSLAFHDRADAPPFEGYRLLRLGPRPQNFRTQQFAHCKGPAGSFARNNFTQLGALRSWRVHQVC